MLAVGNVHVVEEAYQHTTNSRHPLNSFFHHTFPTTSLKKMFAII